MAWLAVDGEEPRSTGGRRGAALSQRPAGEVGEDVEVGEEGDDGRGEEHGDGGGEGEELPCHSNGPALHRSRHRTPWRQVGGARRPGVER